MAGYLILPLLLNCLRWSGCGAVWRYTTSTGRYFIVSTRTSIYLEYEGTTFSKWDVPPFCEVDDEKATSTKLLCLVSGSHKIQPLVTVPSSDDEERYLSIKADVNCFSWYIHQDENRLPDAGPIQDIKVWLFDPETASEKEKRNTADSPPLYSRTLSKQFWNLGQEPSIKTLFSEMEYSSKSFNNGIWMFEVPSLTKDNIATIVGKEVTFQDCFVRSTPFIIAQPIYTLGSETGISVTLPDGSEAIAEWNACYPRTAAVVTADGIFHTSNGFLNVTEIKFPPSLIPSTMIRKVKSIGIVVPYMFILIEKSLYQASIGQVTNIGELYFPRVSFIGLKTITWCSGEYPLSEGKLSEIIFWSEDKIFLGYPENEFHQLITMTLLREKLKLPTEANLLVVDACFESLTASISILLECTDCLKIKVLYLAAYKQDTAEWILKDFTLGLPTVGAIHMEVILSALTSMVLWDDDTVFYTFKDHTQYGYFQEPGTKTNFSAVSKGSTIHQIIIDYIGNAVIKLKNNALFYFKFEVKDIVKLTPWENDIIKLLFYFNPSGDLFLLKMNGTNINRQVYPLKLEVLSAASKLNDICPYISFENNLNLNIYDVDMGDKVTFWGQIVFLENKGLSVDVQTYRPELLKTKDLILYEIARGICTKNKTVTFYHERDYSELPDYRTQIALSQGIMTIQLQPSENGKTCLTEIKYSHIRVGCPPWKKIIVSKKPLECENFTFTIPRKYLRDKSLKGDKEVIFDINKYGCPLQNHYTHDFHPLLEIYKDDKTLIPAEVNYILWEVNGRTDFAYRATMEKVLCLNTAQTWNEMIKLYNKSIETIEDVDEVWGPHNYKSCFKKRSEQLKKLDKKYEILNSSGLNFLTWPQYTSTYMFKLIILDPNFSFCNLSTYFAVQIYGIPERPNWIQVAAWNLSLGTVFWGFLIFSYFKYVKIFRAFPFVDPLTSLRPAVTAEKAYDQEKKD